MPRRSPYRIVLSRVEAEELSRRATKLTFSTHLIRAFVVPQGNFSIRYSLILIPLPFPSPAGTAPIPGSSFYDTTSPPRPPR